LFCAHGLHDAFHFFFSFALHIGASKEACLLAIYSGFSFLLLFMLGARRGRRSHGAKAKELSNWQTNDEEGMLSV